MKLLKFLWVAILLMASVKPAAADSNQPRFMIPTTNIPDDGIIGYSAITAGNPCFTVYLWYRNTDNINTYWKEPPYLIVDGHSVRLTGLSGSHAFDTELPSPNVWECYDKDKLYYTVRARLGFKVRDNILFANKFPDLKSKSNYKDDYYMPLDIYIHENKDGDIHKVEARGYMHNDHKGGSDAYIDAKALNDSTYLYNSGTKGPYKFVQNAALMEWTDVGKLTFVSNDFEDKEWGQFMVVFDGEESGMANDGAITVTKDYGEQADYRSQENKPIEYRYEGLYDPSHPTMRDTQHGVGKITVDDLIFYNAQRSYLNKLYINPVRTWFTFGDRVQLSKYDFRYLENGPLNLKCLDKKICKVVVTPTDNSTPIEWNGKPAYEVVLQIPKGYYKEIEVEYEHGLTGIPIKFSNKYEKDPMPLPYPAELTTTYDAWGKTTTLSWKEANIITDVATQKSNRSGSFKLYRNGKKIKSIDTGSTSNEYSYEDYDTEYDSTYQYKIMFMPTTWQTDSIVESLSANTTARLERTVSISDLQVKTQSDGYLLSWSISPKLDKSGYEFEIYRRTVTADHPNLTAADFDSQSPLTTVKVKDESEQHFTYIDQGVTSTATYCYLVKIVNIQHATFSAGPVIPEGHPDASHIKSLSASRGTFTDHVHLAWDAEMLGDDNLTYDIYRHKINEGENEVNSISAAEQLSWNKLESLVSTKSSPRNSYDDYSAVGGNYYVYAIVARPNGSNEVFTRKMSDGFVRSTGTVTGSVTYADKFAVQGVKVQMTTSATTQGHSPFNSLRLDGGKGGVHWNITPERFNTYFKEAFSMQMYVRPTSNANDGCLLDLGGLLKLQLTDYDAAEGYLISATAGGNTQKTTHRLKADRFTHVTFTYDGNGMAKIHLMAADSLGSIATDQLGMTIAAPENMRGGIAVASATDSTHTMTGYIDEVRFFMRCLTEADVMQNYSHFMGGSESGLVAYWPFDEHISTLRWAYDYSKEKDTDTANENHANIVGGLRTSVETPTADQLSLYAVTDTVGSYQLRGIPFADEGTTYSLIPSKGAHNFKPTTRTLYVSSETLSFDPQNFEDNSSFNVKGVVYYEHTTYPVKGCRFRVDDTVVKDEWGNEVVSNEDGEFTIPVSIGEHAIFIEKDGHTFLNGGRYPAQGLHNFNDSISGLTFTDQTKAVVVGRVAGGSREKDKPVGIGRGNANIGAATLTLLTSNSIENARRMNVTLDSQNGTYESNKNPLYYEQANPKYVNSTAWVGGKDSGSDAVKRITIKTDPATGEFAVLLPPIPYYISTVVDNNSEATAYLSGQTILDCSDVLKKQTAEDEERSLTYNTAFVQTFFSSPEITVNQGDNKVGAFGDAKVPAGELNDTVSTYTVTEDGQLIYNYGYPIMTSCKTYDFIITSSEHYYNYDANKEHPAVDSQPSSEGYLTFSNPTVLAADAVIHAPLDSLGQYCYSFQAIEPNEVAPYTQPITITLTNGDNVYAWNWKNGDYEGPLQCVLFGAKCTGRTSVTAAPDHLIHVLRDPFGSDSYQTWHSGSTKKPAFDIKVGFGMDAGVDSEGVAGAQTQTAEGGPGLYFTSEYYLAAGSSLGFNINTNLEVNGGATWTITSTEDFQTSADPHYDGPDGDLYIGTSSSLIYGDGLKIMLVNDQAGGFKVGTKEVITTAQALGTTFSYSQKYILNDLIPSYKQLIEARLVQVSEAELTAYRASFRNNTDSIIYMTSLTPDDPRFGTLNDDSLAWGKEALKRWELKWRADSLCCYGPSYTVFLPASGKYKDDEEMWDAIVTLNSNIDLWEFYISYNEEGKVKAFNKGAKWIKSFDTGSTVTFGHEDLLNETESIVLSNLRHVYGKCGYTQTTSAGAVGHTEQTLNLSFDLSNAATLKGEREWSDTYSVEMKDHVLDNFHEVEIYRVTDGYDFGGFENDGQNGYGGFIFRQKSGQTSCYYEGEERTKFYEPGRYILSYATVPVQVPHIDCENQVVKNVPAGQPAVFNLKLSNASQANINYNQNYSLMVVRDKWGEKVKVNINGQPGVNDYPLTLEPGKPIYLTVEVEPTSSDIIHIDSLQLSFYSVDEEELSDDIWLTAHFQPKAEPVTLKASKDLINTSTDSTLVLTATGYNIHSSILNGVSMQQRKAGTPEWTTIHSWVKGTPSGDNESPLPDERIEMLIDMRSSIFYPDATYEFRAVTDCTVSDERVLGESETIKVVKDVTLPQPIQLPEPADGVLNEGDNISVTFNEDINSQSLNKPDNFIIQSVLNTDSVAHDVALRLDGATTPAATSQSQLTLGSTSFTLCSWVKSGDTAGTLFRHGDGPDALRIDIDGDGYLSACIKDSTGVMQTYKAVTALKKDIWAYVALVYDVTTGYLSAYSASGDQEQTLMTNVQVGKKVNSKGNIYLGEGLTGAMHEMSLFSAPLTWTTIKAQMYLGKSNSTPALIGYWRLDEGHGTKSEDRARSRHMILASENGWYMENANISMNLDGTNFAAIPMGQLSTTEGASYLVEMWAMADESQDGNAQLLSLDNGQKLDLNLVGGQLQIVADSTAYTTQLSDFNLANHQWHHVALNVLKGGSGQANLIVDGVSVLTVAADKIPALAGAKLWLGKNMKGMIDEVRLWHGTNTQEIIAERMYYRLDGNKEQGLVGYWPMEKTYYDEYNQRVFVFSMENKGYQATAATTLTPNGEEASITEGSDAPGLKMAPNKSNLDFSFVADERTVSVTLDHSAEALEGCTVSTTLRDYYDLNTNVGKPITWSFVVKQNPLTWNVAEVSPRVTAGMSDTFTAKLINNGVADQTWSFAALPSWLEASPSSGTIFAHGNQVITFTVKPGNTIGKYFTTVSARGNKGLDTPLDICLTVEGEQPNWTTTLYPESMTMIGQIKVNSIVSTDPDDMVGAFTSKNGDVLGECVGIGKPKYNSNKDAYFVNMMVYGTKAMEGDKILFRIYDASTGLTYPLTNVSEEVTFKVDASYGSTSNPVIWENSDKLLQTFNLTEQTLWISLYLNPNSNDLQGLFKPVSSIINTVEINDSTTYTYRDGWDGNYEGIKPGEMMKVTMNKDGLLPVIGSAVNPADYPITVNPGPNWIGVPCDSYMTLDEAFAGLAPEDEDVVKGQTGFSTYENNKWQGTLNAIEPGKGYIYTSRADTTKVFRFPSNPTTAGISQWEGVQGIAANFKYKNSMVVVCTVHDEYDQPIVVDSIGAFDSFGELRGKVSRCFRDSLHFLLISGDRQDEPIHIRPKFANFIGNDNSDFVLNFSKDKIIGRLKKPVVFQLTNPTGISEFYRNADNRLTVYNTLGNCLYSGRAGDFDRHKLPANVIYIISEETSDGRIITYKRMNK